VPSGSFHGGIDWGEMRKDEVVLTSLVYQVGLTNLHCQIAEGGMKRRNTGCVYGAYLRRCK